MNFKQSINTVYPPNNFQIFEEWFSWQFSLMMINGPNEPFETYKGYKYLDIFWTSYQVNNDYGKDTAAMSELQRYVDSLDRSKRWFSVLQYDDGPLVDFKDLDIKIFGSGGGRIDFPIPLVTAPHPYEFGIRRDVFASFAGSMTHPIRRKMVQNLRHRYKIPMKHLPIKDYCELMARSIFSLAPRGYGQSSFRICEALQFGSIPVYISDHWIVPGNIDFNEYGVLVHSDEIRNLDKILKGFTHEQIRSKQEAGGEIYKRLYTFEGCRQLILDNL